MPLKYNDAAGVPHQLQRLCRGSARLEKLGTPISVPKNYELNRVNEIPDACYMVKSGRVLCCEIAYTGDERIYSYMEPGSLLMEEYVLFDRVCPVTFRTMAPTDLIRIDKCDLKRAFKRDIDVVMDVCESLSDKFLSAMESNRPGVNQSAPGRICKLLLLFADSFGEEREDGTTLIREKISQQMISNLLGLNRITVTRRIRDMKEADILGQEDGYYTIRRPEMVAYMNSIEE